MTVYYTVNEYICDTLILSPTNGDLLFKHFKTFIHSCFFHNFHPRNSHKLTFKNNFYPVGKLKK